MKKRNTIQKNLVLKAVCQLTCHPTAEEIYIFIKDGYPDISRATVYRNLNILAEEGRIKRISVPDSADRFDVTVTPHYHIKCTDCGCFIDLKLPYFQDIDRKAADETGYIMEEHDIVFRGICPGCARKNDDGSSDI